MWKRRGRTDRSRYPPVVPIALAYAAGISLPSLGVSLSTTLLPPVLALSLFLLWRRPWPEGVLALLLLAGVVAGETHLRSLKGDCRFQIPAGWEGEIGGRFLTRPTLGRSFPFQIESGAPGGCTGVVRASMQLEDGLPRSGEGILVRAQWQRRAFPLEDLPEWAGTLRLSNDWTPGKGGGMAGWALGLRGRIQERIVELWGEDAAPIVEALVLERREHVDVELRDAFSLSGTVHLLSISGFHVGVIAALLVGLLRILGMSPRRAAGWAAVVCWIYILGIGAPHAAVRAALLFTLLVVARLRGRPVVSSGLIASCLLLLLLLNPGWLFSVGLQLSVAGTAGLLFLRAPVAAGMDALYRWVRGRPLPSGKQVGGMDALLKEGAGGMSAGIAATLPTLPLLAWHFDRISLLGIPLTIVLAPIIAAAIPGIGVSLLLSVLHLELGRFLAGGTGLLLEVGNRIVFWGAALPGASFWVSRGGLLAVLGGGGGALLLMRWSGARRRVRPAVRHAVAAGWGAGLLLLLPILPAERRLELHMIDVGQGDAIALRSPGGRWILIDAGPRSVTFDAGARRVVPYLRREGVRTLEALLLTHPHLDHIGGAPEVLRSLEVRGVIDPSRPHGSRPYLEVVEEATREKSWWWPAEEGQTFHFDGAVVEVLHPGREVVTAADLPDPNDLSIVLLVRWGNAAILLTGDAPAGVEREVLDRIPRLTLLKVGHHGSRTSSSQEMLGATAPRLAVIGVGDGNSFGHPHGEVVGRLTDAGTEILRTDRDGDIRVRIQRDGEVEVHTSR